MVGAKLMPWLLAVPLFQAPISTLITLLCAGAELLVTGAVLLALDWLLELDDGKLLEDGRLLEDDARLLEELELLLITLELLLGILELLLEETGVLLDELGKLLLEDTGALLDELGALLDEGAGTLDALELGAALLGLDSLLAELTITPGWLLGCELAEDTEEGAESDDELSTRGLLELLLASGALEPGCAILLTDEALDTGTMLELTLDDTGVGLLLPPPPPPQAASAAVRLSKANVLIFVMENPVIVIYNIRGHSMAKRM